MANTDTERGSVTGERSSSNDKNKIETSERGSNETKGEHGSQPQKGKQKATTQKVANQSMQSAIETSENNLLAAINSLQGAITKQTSRMEDHEKQIEDQNKQLREVTSKLASYEECEGDELDYDYECDEGHNRDFSLNENEQTACAESPLNPYSESMKRKAVDDDNNKSFQINGQMIYCEKCNYFVKNS